MGIEEQVKQVLEDACQTMATDSGFVELQAFYVEMQQLGLARQQEYSLPPLDTAGRRVYELTESIANRSEWLKL